MTAEPRDGDKVRVTLEGEYRDHYGDPSLVFKQPGKFDNILAYVGFDAKVEVLERAALKVGDKIENGEDADRARTGTILRGKYAGVVALKYLNKWYMAGMTTSQSSSNLVHNYGGLIVVHVPAVK